MIFGQLERIAVALELIAARLGEPNNQLVARVANLKELLKNFVGVMENPKSSDRDWNDLLSDVKEALGVESSDEVSV